MCSRGRQPLCHSASWNSTSECCGMTCGFPRGDGVQGNPHTIAGVLRRAGRIVCRQVRTRSPGHGGPDRARAPEQDRPSKHVTGSITRHGAVLGVHTGHSYRELGPGSSREFPKGRQRRAAAARRRARADPNETAARGPRAVVRSNGVVRGGELVALEHVLDGLCTTLRKRPVSAGTISIMRSIISRACRCPSGACRKPPNSWRRAARRVMCREPSSQWKGASVMVSL